MKNHSTVLTTINLQNVLTTKELADRLGQNPAYVLRRAKEELIEGQDYRSTGPRNYIFWPTAYDKMRK